MSEIEDRILVITDLLLGAAYADDALAGEEEAAVRRLLGELLGGAALPLEVDTRIETFRPDGFDMVAAAKGFAADPPIAKRKLLELVAAVSDADDEVDLEEDAYLVALAKALGMQPDDYADLTLHVQVEDLKKALGDLRKVSQQA
jgi:uncharacterized tellurite resistance protein B-like protein